MVRLQEVIMKGVLLASVSLQSSQASTGMCTGPFFEGSNCLNTESNKTNVIPVNSLDEVPACVEHCKGLKLNKATAKALLNLVEDPTTPSTGGGSSDDSGSGGSASPDTGGGQTDNNDAGDTDDSGSGDSASTDEGEGSTDESPPVATKMIFPIPNCLVYLKSGACAVCAERRVYIPQSRSCVLLEYDRCPIQSSNVPANPPLGFDYMMQDCLHRVKAELENVSAISVLSTERYKEASDQNYPRYYLPDTNSTFVQDCAKYHLDGTCYQCTSGMSINVESNTCESAPQARRLSVAPALVEVPTCIANYVADNWCSEAARGFCSRCLTSSGITTSGAAVLSLDELDVCATRCAELRVHRSVVGKLLGLAEPVSSSNRRLEGATETTSSGAQQEDIVPFFNAVSGCRKYAITRSYVELSSSFAEFHIKKPRGHGGTGVELFEIKDYTDYKSGYCIECATGKVFNHIQEKCVDVAATVADGCPCVETNGKFHVAPNRTGSSIGAYFHGLGFSKLIEHPAVNAWTPPSKEPIGAVSLIDYFSEQNQGVLHDSIESCCVAAAQNALPDVVEHFDHIHGCLMYSEDGACVKCNAAATYNSTSNACEVPQIDKCVEYSEIDGSCKTCQTVTKQISDTEIFKQVLRYDSDLKKCVSPFCAEYASTGECQKCQIKHSARPDRTNYTVDNPAMIVCRDPYRDCPCKIAASHDDQMFFPKNQYEVDDSKLDLEWYFEFTKDESESTARQKCTLSSREVPHPRPPTGNPYETYSQNLKGRYYPTSLETGGDKTACSFAFSDYIPHGDQLQDYFSDPLAPATKYLLHLDRKSDKWKSTTGWSTYSQEQANDKTGWWLQELPRPQPGDFNYQSLLPGAFMAPETLEEVSYSMLDRERDCCFSLEKSLETASDYWTWELASGDRWSRQ